MKRRIRLLAILLAGALVAGACGDDDDDTADTTAVAAGETTAAETTAATAGDTSADTVADTTAGDTDTTTAPPDGDADPDATLTVGAVLAPPSLDITTQSGAGVPQLLLYNVYETLVKIDDEGEFQPLLAAELPEVSDDGLMYTFTIRDGVTFHDGDELTAADVKASFDRAKANDAAPAIIAETFAIVSSVETPDDSTVVITLTSRSRNFLFNIAQTSGVVLSEDVDPETLANEENGSGPFQLDAATLPESVRLARFDGYWGEPAGVAAVEVRYITDASALANAARAGDIDIVTNIAPELFGEFEADTDNYETVNGLTSGETILAMNNSRPPLDQPEVRQAISHAINKQDIVDAAESGYGQIIGTHSSPTDPWYVEVDKYPFDPDAARALLTEAGVADGTPLRLRLPPTPYAQAAGPIVQQQLNDVGFDVQIENVEFPLWISEVFTNADYDLTIISHVEARDVGRFGNPDYYWKYDNPAVQTLLQEADEAPTDEESDAKYEEALNLIADDAPVVWLFLLPDLRVIRKGVTNYPVATFSLSFDMAGITKAG